MMAALRLTLFVSVWLAGTAGFAEAAFLVPLIAGAAFAATTAGAVISFGLNLAAGLALSFVSSALFKPKGPQAAKQRVGGAQLDLRIDADIPQSVIFGRAATAGSLVYAETYGYIPATETVEEIRNSNLIEIISIADHPVHALVSVYVEGQARTLSNTGTDRGSVVDGYADKLAIKFFDGTQISADLYAYAALGAHSERPWSLDCVGTGIAYARQHSIYDQDKVPGRLTWKYVIDGALLYDPRKDTTVGGSGSHRFDDLDTHEFSGNFAVIAYNVLRGYRVKNAAGVPVHFYGLEGTPAANLPLDNWFAAMNECDAVVDGAPQYHGGGEVTIDTEPHAFLKELLKACDGRLSELGGIYKLHVGAPELPVISITDDALRADESDPFKPILPLTQRVNYVTGKFMSPADGWTPKVAPPRANAEWEAADGRRLSADLDAALVQSDPHIQRLMQQMMRRARQQRRHVLPLGPEAFGVEPGDAIDWTSARNGYSDKVFRIDGVDVHANLNVTLAVTEEDPADYDWESETDLLPSTVLPLAINRPAPKVLEDFAAEPYTILGANGIRRPAILLTWTPPEDGDINGVGVRVRRPEYPADIFSLMVEEPESGQVIIATSLAPNTEYEVGARFRSFNGWPTEWSLWIPVTTPDVGFNLAEIERGTREYLQALETRLRQIESDIRGVAAVAAGHDADTLLLRALERGTLKTRTEEFRTGIAGVSASVTEVAQIAADAEAAVASLTTTVTAQYGALTASIEVNSTAIATVNGKLSLSHGVTLDNDGYVSGTYNYNAGEGLSGFLAHVDYFAIGTPSVGGSEVVYPFIVSTINGVAAVGISGALVVDGSITTPSLAAGSITSVKLAADSVTAGKVAAGAVDADDILADSVVVTRSLRAEAATAVLYVTGADGTVFSNTALVTTSFNVVVGPVVINAWVYINFASTGAGPFNLRVLVDGSPVEAYTPAPLRGLDSSDNPINLWKGWYPVPVMAMLTPGSREIALQMTFNEAQNVSYSKPRLIIMESRR